MRGDFGIISSLKLNINGISLEYKWCNRVVDKVPCCWPLDAD